MNRVFPAIMLLMLGLIPYSLHAAAPKPPKPHIQIQGVQSVLMQEGSADSYNLQEESVGTWGSGELVPSTSPVSGVTGSINLTLTNTYNRPAGVSLPKVPVSATIGMQINDKTLLPPGGIVTDPYWVYNGPIELYEKYVYSDGSFKVRRTTPNGIIIYTTGVLGGQPFVEAKFDLEPFAGMANYHMFVKMNAQINY